jgi:PAS domain S-box-containing protein
MMRAMCRAFSDDGSVMHRARLTRGNGRVQAHICFTLFSYSRRSLMAVVAQMIRQARWTRRDCEVAAFWGLLYLAAACIALTISRNTAGMAAVWPSNGILLAGLLLSSRPRGVLLVACCAVASTVANLIGGVDLPTALGFTCANLVTALLCFALLRRSGAGPEVFESFAGIIRFLVALGIAVACGSTIAAAIMLAADGRFSSALAEWASSDYLGTVLITAFVLGVARHTHILGPCQHRIRPRSMIWPLLAVVVVTVCVFAQSRFPMLFVPLAVLLVATFRTGMIGAVAGTLAIAIIGTGFMVMKMGPIALVEGSIGLRIAFFQFYLAVLLGTSLPLATALAERNRMARERAASERHHRRIVDQSREVIFETDLGGRWTFLNPAWQEMTGHAAADTLGTSFLSIVVEEDRPEVLARLAPLYRREIEECRQDVRYKHASGEVRWATVRSHLLTNDDGDGEGDGDGAVVGIYGTLHDVTDRKHAEQIQQETATRLEEANRLLLMAEDLGQIGHWHFNLVTESLYWSEVVYGIYGFSPAEPPTLSAALEAYHPDDAPVVQELVGRALASGEDYAFKARLVRPDGSCRHVMARGRADVAEDGSIRGVFGVVHDMTDAFEAEQALRESEGRYKLLADHATDIVLRLDEVGNCLFVSPSVREITGVQPADLIGRNLISTIDRADRYKVLRHARLVRDKLGKPSVFDFRVRHLDGRTLWLEANLRASRDPVTRKIDLIGTARSVGRRKEAEAEARSANERLAGSVRLLQMAEAAAHLGHWRVDMAEGKHFWSDETYRIHGMPSDHVPTFENTLEAYHPEDVDRVRNIVERAFADGESYSFRARVLKPDGTLVHIFIRGAVDRDSSGNITGLFGIVQDVTEQALAEASLREREARYRLITDQASDMISLHEADGTCLFMSPSVRSILGYEPEEMLGTSPLLYAPSEDQPTIEQHRLDLIATPPGGISAFRMRMRRRDGSYAWMEVAARIVDYLDDQRIVAVWRDVTDRVRVEAELVETRSRAEAAAKAKSIFLANMSHEIRTPMNGVLGFADLLLAGELQPDQRRHAELIADSGRAMMRLLNDILDLSKVEAGQMKVSEEPFDLPHALGACMKLMVPAAAQKGITLCSTLAGDLPKIVAGDGLRLRQIVLNILGNATKFTAVGGITLTASAADRPDGAKLVSIEVTDTGIGIPKERQAAIFEQFVQADNETAPKFGGTGLGLAISLQLARLMGGDLRLESEPGRGTRVLLTLPLRPVDAASGATSQKTATVPASARAPAISARPAHVLIAEDHDVNQMLIVAMLKQLGHRPEIVDNGAKAFARATECRDGDDPFDIVLMDMQMPEMDGIEATRRIRAAGITADALPILALTANAYVDDVAACLGAGMQAHLAKPIKLAELDAALARWLPARPEAAVPAPPPAAASAGFSPAIQARYRARKDETLHALDELVRSGVFEDATVETVAELLHKLAGTAGMFGDAELGERARELETGLRSWPRDDLPAMIEGAVTRMRAAA